MAALNFPNSPSLNDTHTENGVTFKWNGAAWDRLGDIGAQGATGSTGAQGSTGPVAGSSSQVVYKDGSNNPAGSANFTFDGTNLTVGGNVSIGGTLTYEDVTNIDSVGLITARAGVKVPDGERIFVGTDDDLVIYHDGNTRVRHTGAGDLLLQSNSDVYIQRASDGHQMIIAENDGPVKLYYDNSEKFQTTSTGINVTGTVTCDGLTSDGLIQINSGLGEMQIIDNDNTGTAAQSRIRFRDSGGTYQASLGMLSATNSHFHIENEVSGDIILTTGGNERLRVLSGGNIGIGTINPQSKMHISGTGEQTIRVDTSGTALSVHNHSEFMGFIGNDAGKLFINAGGTEDTLSLRTAGLERLRIDSSGQTTIGGAIFNYQGTSKPYNNNAATLWGTHNIGLTGQWSSINWPSDHSDPEPSQPWYMMGRAHGSTDSWALSIRPGSSNSLYRIIECDNDSNGYISNLKFHTSNGQERLRITSAGLVGVNCTPLSQFHVKTGTDANIAFSTMSSEASIEAYNDAGSASVPLRLRASVHKFFIGSTEGLRVHTNGLIGVGHDSPTVYGRMTVAMPSQSGGAAIQVANSSLGSGDGSTSNIVLRSVNNSGSNWADAEYRASQHIFAIQGTERLRITSGGQVNIGGNYTQTSYQLQVDGSVKGDYFTGESLSNRTGYKWGASGIYYLTLGGSRSGNGPSFTMFELTGMNNSKFVEIQISFAHAGGGSHGSYRRAVYTSNGYLGLNTLENVASNYGGGGGFTISKPTNDIIRVVYNGSSSYADAYTLCCEVKTSNSTTVFQNVDSAFT